MWISFLFTHTWIAIQLILFFSPQVGSCEDFCITGESSRAFCLLEDLWNERKSDPYQFGISASLCFGQEACVVILLYRKSLERGQHSQRTPWEEREDHVEEQDGTLLNQHSAARDHNQPHTQAEHNYLPNKGHFDINPTRAWEGNWIVVMLKVNWKWNVVNYTYGIISKVSIVRDQKNKNPGWQSSIRSTWWKEYCSDFHGNTHKDYVHFHQ